MTDHPISFSPEMVRAILDGRKTLTRRLVKPNKRAADGVIVVTHNGRSWPYNMQGDSEFWGDGRDHPIPCPYGAAGDRLWVRENFSVERLPHNGQMWTPATAAESAAKLRGLKGMGYRAPDESITELESEG